LKEIHHRVKNNLQIISSLLNLQAGYVVNSQLLDILRESRARIRSMAIIHEKLYQSEDLHNIEFAGYIRSLATSLFSSYQLKPSDVKLALDVQNILLDLDRAIPCGLIINELFTNALKHAFPFHKEYPADRPPEILISFSRIGESKIELKICDNGIGFPTEKFSRQPTSLGLRLVCALADQIEAKVKLKTDVGTSWRIVFPEGSR
jgi:two-component sensor histidine kinase